MPADLHLDPDRLRAHAVRAAELAQRVGALSRPEADRLARAGRGLAERVEELASAVARSARTLDELSSDLCSAAGDAERVDRRIGREILRAGWDTP